MKLIVLLSSIALLTLGAFVLELSFNPHALGLYAVSASALILLGVARDYAPRRYWEPRTAVVPFRGAPAVRPPSRLAA